MLQISEFGYFTLILSNFEIDNIAWLKESPKIKRLQLFIENEQTQFLLVLLNEI